MFRSVTAPFAAAARESLNRGLTALVWVCVIAGLLIIGAGFLVAAVFLGLSMVFGPVLASILLGLVMIVLALLIATLRRGRPLGEPRLPAMPQPVPPEPNMTPMAAPLGELAFVVGFVAARTLLRRLGRRSRP